MPLDLFLALVMFAFVMACTPGPNNIMLTASGVNFGFARSLPHMSGVTLGFLVMVGACAAGLGLVFATVPALQLALKIAGAGYMLWLAWKVANARPSGEGDGEEAGRPLTFLQAAAFQWVNPKGVLAALSGIALFMRPGHALTDFTIMIAIYALATTVSVLIWTGFGVALRQLLQNPRHARIFNVAMAVLLVASIVPMVT
jgi:threonine/homoserine/homoserine lactone efflux protein